MAEPVKVKIFGQEYRLKSEENVENVQKVAGYVNEKVKEIQLNAEGLSEKKTAILAALNIASEYFQLKNEKEEMLGDIRKRTRVLIKNIDSIMG